MQRAYDAAGIESPGLSCAPALGKYLAQMIAEAAGAAIKGDFKATRKGLSKRLSFHGEERAKLIKRTSGIRDHYLPL